MNNRFVFAGLGLGTACVGTVLVLATKPKVTKSRRSIQGVDCTVYTDYRTLSQDGIVREYAVVSSNGSHKTTEAVGQLRAYKELAGRQAKTYLIPSEGEQITHNGKRLTVETRDSEFTQQTAEKLAEVQVAYQRQPWLRRVLA